MIDRPLHTGIAAFSATKLRDIVTVTFLTFWSCSWRWMSRDQHFRLIWKSQDYCISFQSEGLGHM